MGLLRRSPRSETTVDAEVVGVAPTPKGARQTERRDVEHELRLRVPVAGPEPVDVVHITRVPWDRVPLLGQRIPVALPDGGLAGLRVRWDEVPSLVDRARASTEASQRGDAAGAAAALGYRLRD